MVYSEFIGMAKQVPVNKQLLPIPPIEKPKRRRLRKGRIWPNTSVNRQPMNCSAIAAQEQCDVQIYSALLETSTSEHAARMMAMDNATKACNDMIDNLTLAYNKARQAAITADLMDIVGGAEALKG
jgi:F-type H+-transporting ATPase subunit gamma